MAFSFKVKKGFLKVNVVGKIEVLDDQAVIEFSLPKLVARFISEDELRDMVVSRTSSVFADNPDIIQ